MRRRRFFAVPLILALSGCGFHPVYAPLGEHAPTADLAHVFVAVIPNRSGQLLRQALQRRLEGSTGPLAPRYTLSIAYALTSEGIGIDPSTSVTFIRYHGQADWKLLGADPAKPPLTTGVATAQDGYSTIINQYFFQSFSTDAVTERVADALADQISARLAAWFAARDRTAQK